jgi:hypothetical protein
LLQQEGYKTQFVGKYFALYPGYGGGAGVKVAPYIPPGWDSWVGRAVYATNTLWTEFRYILGSTAANSGVGISDNANPQYTTYYERDRIIDFINSSGNSPFYAVLSLTAPHEPATPAAGDENLYGGYVYTSPGRSETDLSDKPSWVKNYSGAVHDDALIRKQLQSLKAVDRVVGDLIDELDATGKLDNTVIIFTSDNGFLWGEHGMWGKAKPHEEALRVPLVIRMPGVTPRTESGKLIAANLDVPQTILELAGVSLAADGASMVELLSDPGVPWRDELLFESFGHNVGGNGLWAALRTADWKFIDHPIGTDELYDMVNDPYELQSLHASPQHASIRNTLSSQLNSLKGLNITSLRWNLPSGAVGQSYNYQLQAWGGTTPYSWSVNSGQLPPGLTLNVNIGVVSGTPTQTGNYTVSFKVQGSGLRSHSGVPEVFKSLGFVFQIGN